MSSISYYFLLGCVFSNMVYCGRSRDDIKQFLERWGCSSTTPSAVDDTTLKEVQHDRLSSINSPCSPKPILGSCSFTIVSSILEKKLKLKEASSIEYPANIQRFKLQGCQILQSEKRSVKS